MSVGFGKKRRVLPNPNLGQEFVAQRRVSEAAGRAAEKSRISVLVDGHPCRLWVRNPRGTIPCPCSSATLGGYSTPLSPEGRAEIIIQHGEGDDLGAPDSGYPQAKIPPAAGTENRVHPYSGDTHTDGWIDDVGRMLLGQGRRCGICWGTGWLDGYHMWGGLRVICCVIPTVETTITEDGGVDVDFASPTPTMIGPGTVEWSVNIPPYFNKLDVLRVRDGLGPASGEWNLNVISIASPSFTDASTALGIDVGMVAGQCISQEKIPTAFQLVLGEGARVSHIEFVLRSEELINVQMPQLQQAASTELVAPFIQLDFEIDPLVGYLERGTVYEIAGINGHISSVWIISDIMMKKTAQGVIYGITGSVRNIQPTETLAAASLDESLSIGILDPGLATRGPETTGAGVASGLDGDTDESVAAVNRGTHPRLGGGAAPSGRSVIVLSSSQEDELE